MPNVPVLWSREAEDSLTRLWIDHPSLRNAISSAAHAIDRQLEEDSHRFAVERRPDNWAVAFEPPLGVEFVLGNPIMTLPTEVCRAWFSTQGYVKSDFMSIFLLTFVGRTSTLKHLM